MKLLKINLNELSNDDLNEREMCRLLGGGTPGNCQCSCAGSSTTGTNNSANDANGLSSTTASSSSSNNNTYDCDCDIMRINDNYSCCPPTNCNSAPNKCSN